MSLAARLALAALACLVALACTQRPPVRTETYGSGRAARELNVDKVAIAPFRAMDLYPRTGGRNMDPKEATQLLERFVSEALQRRGVRVVSAGDVRSALGLTDSSMAVPPPRIVADVVHRKFGVEGVVFGKVYRMRNQEPSVMGASRAASVWFEVELIKAPGAAKLWDATFNETQRPLNENIFHASRYPGGGTRWLSAEELARWGASELAREFPSGGATSGLQ